jgi:hypothetical protein
MERRQNRGRIVEGVEWRERMKEQNGEKTDWRKNCGRSRMKGKNDGTKISLDVWFRQNFGGGRMEEKK